MRQNLLDKATSILESKGAAALSMRQLANKTGLSAMAAYRHFSCKDELLLEIAARGFDQLTSAGESAAQNESTPRKRLEAVCFAYYAFGKSTRAYLI